MPETRSATAWRDRALPALALAFVTAIAWAYLAHHARGTGAGGGGMAVAQLRAWTAIELLLLFAMWAVMMVAMMLPSAAPVILLFDSIAERRRHQRRAYVPTAVFVGGYLLVWTGYSALATFAQWGLHTAALLSPMMASTSGVLSGTMLVTAGVFQFTPLKDACLKACRSPLGWLTTEWREGRMGSLVMGIRHGAYCAGCCWALMALLFVAGVMNLVWVAVLSGLVLVEKVAPAGEWLGRVAAVLLVGWGVWLMMGVGA